MWMEQSTCLEKGQKKSYSIVLVLDCELLDGKALIFLVLLTVPSSLFYS